MNDVAGHFFSKKLESYHLKLILKLNFNGNLYVVRHGETVWNKEHRYQGSENSPLTDTGIAQARQIGQKLRNNHIEVVISSPLGRAKETAEIIAAFLQIKQVEIENDMKERAYGCFEGLSKDQAAELFPDLMASKVSHQYDNAPAGGETIRIFEKRILSGLENLYGKFLGKKLLLVCHLGTMRILHKYFNNLEVDKEFFDYFPKNGEIVVY